MTDYYLDASALVKRYAPEPGSDWVLEITNPTAGHTIILSEITLAEIAAALAAKQRAPRGLALEERDRALGRFLQDCAEIFLLLQIDRSVIDLDFGQIFYPGPTSRGRVLLNQYMWGSSPCV